MFYQGYPILMSRIRPDAIPLPRAAKPAQPEIEAEAARAMTCDLGDMKLSDRLRRPGDWQTLQMKRRGALEALMIVPPTPALLERVTDLVCMISEESVWSANPAGAPFDDENQPAIDLQAVETAVLFGWARRFLGPQLDEIDPRITNRMVCEVRRRLFRPVQVHDDYPFMTGSGACPMATAAGIILACLLLESDEARVSRILKPMLTLLDEICARHGRAFVPLTETVTDISAVSDLAVLMRDLTDDALDLTASIPTGDWLDEILFSWIQDQTFNDPAGSGMQPPLSGSDIFRIGFTAGDEPLTALGAMQWHTSHLPSTTVTGRLLDRALCAQLAAVSGRPPRLRYAAMRNNMLMAARMPGLYCSMHTGGGRANAGDIVLFADGAPILTDGGNVCARSLPVLNGHTQLNMPRRACIADFEDRSDREIMSVDLTHAYPPETGLRSYQRTVLTLRNEQTVRIVDAVSFSAPAPASFRFVTAAHPTLLSNAVRLGSVRLTWEGHFSTAVESLSGGLHLLTLTCDEPVQQALFSFNFEKA